MCITLHVQHCTPPPALHSALGNSIAHVFIIIILHFCYSRQVIDYWIETDGLFALS